MAECRLTHIGKFSQQFYRPIPILRELMLWVCFLIEHADEAVRVIFMTSDEGMARKRLDHDQRRGLPPNPRPFLNIS